MEINEINPVIVKDAKEVDNRLVIISLLEKYGSISINYIGGAVDIFDNYCVLAYPLCYLEIPIYASPNPRPGSPPDRIQPTFKKVFETLDVPEFLWFRHKIMHILSSENTKEKLIGELYERNLDVIKAADAGIIYPSMEDIMEISKKEKREGK